MPTFIAILLSILLVLISIIPSYVGLDLASGPFLSISRILFIFLSLLTLLILIHYKSLTSISLSSRRCPVVIPTGKTGKIIILYAICMILAAILSTNIYDSLLVLFSEKYLLGIIFMILGFNVAQTNYSRELIEQVLIFSAILTIAIALIDIILGFSIYTLVDLPGRDEIKEGFFAIKERLGYIRLQSSMNNPLTYGLFLTLVFPLVIFNLRKTSKKINRVLLSFVAIGIVLVAFMTLVRSVIIVLLLQIIFLRNMIFSRNKIIVYTLSLFLAIGIAFYKHDVLTDLYTNMFLQEDRTVKHSTLYRSALLYSGLIYFAETPIFGIGQNRFSSEVKGEYLGSEIYFKHHENYFLTILVETGVVGFIAFIWIIWRAIIILRRTNNANTLQYHKNLTKTYIAILFGWGIISLFLDSLSYSQISIPFWLLLGIALGFDKRVKCIHP